MKSAPLSAEEIQTLCRLYLPHRSKGSIKVIVDRRWLKTASPTRSVKRYSTRT